MFYNDNNNNNNNNKKNNNNGHLEGLTLTPKLAISTLKQSANASSPRLDTQYAPMFRQLKKEKILDTYNIRPKNEWGNKRSGK